MKSLSFVSRFALSSPSPDSSSDARMNIKAKANKGKLSPAMEIAKCCHRYLMTPKAGKSRADPSNWENGFGDVQQGNHRFDTITRIIATDANE